MNVDTFRARYPEFSSVATLTLQATLDEAALRLNKTVYGNRYDEAHGYITAHKLASSPMGQGARMTSKSGETVYLQNFRMIQREMAGGYGIAGDPPEALQNTNPWGFPWT